MNFKEDVITYDVELDGDICVLKLGDVGRVDFLKRENEVTILFITVKPEYRRHGHATEMLRYLGKKYEIRWDGRFTADGRLLYKSLAEPQLIGQFSSGLKYT